MKSEIYLSLLVKKVKIWHESDEPDWMKKQERDKLLVALYLHLKLKNKQQKKRRFWVRHIYKQEQRLAQGASDNLVIEMLMYDHEKYQDFFRMDPAAFNDLLKLIKFKITKQTVVRIPISAKTRLEICLRFLASGDLTKSIEFLFRVAPNTVSKIVSEVCEAIWDVLSEMVFPKLTEDMWKEKAKEFEEIWNFPNCIGAIDGKHCLCEAPDNSGSANWNYKDSFSFILLAVADANAMFTMVDIGAEERNSDAGVFLRSEMGACLDSNTLNIPPPTPIIPNGPKIPHLLAGDEAFGLCSYMMRPYPRRGLTLEKKVYNYRHSRARRIIECAFGILVARWMILKRKIRASPMNIINYIKACTCLHNFLMSREIFKPANERHYSSIPSEEKNQKQADATNNERSNEFSMDGVNIREALKNYFCSEEGEIEGQWEKAANNDF